MIDIKEIRKIEKKFSEWNRKSEKDGYYPAIKFPLEQFVFRAKEWLRHFDFSDSVFVDIGSGNGEKLYTASKLGFKHCIGIEVSKDSCILSREVLKRNQNITLYNTDFF